MKPILVKCDCCEGTGKRALSDVLLKTLAVIPINRFVSTDAVTKALGDCGVKPTAINNRLAQELLPLGLVTRERHGKWWHWKRTK